MTRSTRCLFVMFIAACLVAVAEVILIGRAVMP